MRVFSPQGQRGEGIGTKKGFQHIAAVKHVEPGQTENDERSGQQPMGKALDSVEALDDAIAPTGIDFDTSPKREE